MMRNNVKFLASELYRLLNSKSITELIKGDTRDVENDRFYITDTVETLYFVAVHGGFFFFSFYTCQKKKKMYYI